MQYLENAIDTLVFENDFIRREITFRNGKPVATALTRLDSGYTWRSAKEAPLLHLPGFDWDLVETTYEDSIITFTSNYIVRWVFTVAENTPAIRSQLFAKALPIEETGIESAIDGLDDGDAAAPEADIIDRIFHAGRHVRLDHVRFFDRTDHIDSLVREERAYLYHAEERFDGNLFFFTDPTVGETCMIQKEAPSAAAHLNRISSDVRASSAQFSVLGSGIDVIYPSCHRDLYEEIAERGAVITEFLPGTRPMRENFPIRNRIISGMARGLIVVEAGDRSGTSITAGYALDQGREVFAVPGRLTDLQSIGANRMIQRGEAKPIFCVADVLQEFEQIDDYDAFQSGPKRIAWDTLSTDEQAVCNALKTDSRSFDDLAEMLSRPVGQLNSLLTGMQFSGIIKPLSGRLYALDTLNSVLVDDSSANEGLEDE